MLFSSLIKFIAQEQNFSFQETFWTVVTSIELITSTLARNLKMFKSKDKETGKVLDVSIDIRYGPFKISEKC